MIGKTANSNSTVALKNERYKFKKYTNTKFY